MSPNWLEANHAIVDFQRRDAEHNLFFPAASSRSTIVVEPPNSFGERDDEEIGAHPRGNATSSTLAKKKTLGSRFMRCKSLSEAK